MNQNEPCRQIIDQKPFSPIFIVGAPRSGTTMLAVLLDRHSRIAISPETQFFTEFVPQFQNEVHALTKEELVDFALTHRRIRDLQLSRDVVLDVFNNYSKSLPSLLRALIECHAITKGKIIPGEKSPGHIQYVPDLLSAFPNAKVICIIRDGRDVVRSLLNVEWAEPNNPRRFGLFCTQWNHYANITRQYTQNLPKEQFLVLKYEEIVESPANSLRTACDFIGVEFEQTQLHDTVSSDVVPAWEKDWKSKATKGVDPKRVYAWRQAADRGQVWAMNCMMEGPLNDWGYLDTELSECPIHKKILLNFLKIPYLPVMRPLSLFGLYLARKIRWTFFTKSKEQSCTRNE